MFSERNLTNISYNGNYNGNYLKVKSLTDLSRIIERLQ